MLEIIIFAIVMYVICKFPEWKFNNRTTPDGYETDWGAMSHDLAMGKSKNEVMAKSNRGGYDIPKKN